MAEVWRFKDLNHQVGIEKIVAKTQFLYLFLFLINVYKYQPYTLIILV